MITKIYLGVIIALFSSPLIQSLARSGEGSNRPVHLSTHYGVVSQALRDSLTLDFQLLNSFSEDLSAYAITRERFEVMFWEGAQSAYRFYQSPQRFRPSSVNQLLAGKFFPVGDSLHFLDHPDAIPTDLPVALEALEAFSGKWYGQWKTMKVRHLWLPVQQTHEPLPKGPTLVGFQSCFTGDGFGWNYVVEEQGKAVILGFVYHFQNQGELKGTPHYAYLNTQQQLTWVSNDHIYFEFVCDHQQCSQPKHYVITGGQYEQQGKSSKLVSGFQAQYVRKNGQLPEFRELPSIPLKRSLFNSILLGLKRLLLQLIS